MKKLVLFMAVAATPLLPMSTQAAGAGGARAHATSITAITQCLAALHHGQGNQPKSTTVAQAKDCAPGATVIAAGAVTSAAGAYVDTNGHILLVTSTPVAPPAASPASTSCAMKGYTNWDGGWGYEDLSDQFCWTGSEAWATNPPIVYCFMYPIPPWGSCVSNTKGVINNYTTSYSNPVNPWANFYNDYPPCGIGSIDMRMYMQPNGNWWQKSYTSGGCH